MSSINHRISLIAKQIEYRYIAYKNNQAVEKAFVYGFKTPPFEKAFAFTRDHSLPLALFVTGFVGISLFILSQPIGFSKPMPQNLEIDAKIRERLENIQPSVPNIDRLEKLETVKPQQVKITPFVKSPVISRKAFLEKSSPYTILVNKRTKKLFVTEEKNNGYSVVEEFPISIGLVPGDKKLEGDEKTLEGAYTLIDFKTDGELPVKYGPYAAVLNYPNKKDIEEGKTGSGIWIHGTGTNQLTPDTQGCVELSDEHLIQLFSFISKGTKIIIVPGNIDITPKTNIVQKNLISLATAS
tara:strand:- start:460 stop:1350 length:891 start_codon:yes stop_codon:yes gene_type:complete